MGTAAGQEGWLISQTEARLFTWNVRWFDHRSAVQIIRDKVMGARMLHCELKWETPVYIRRTG